MIEGLPLPPANATAPHLSDPPIGPRPRHFVRLAHGINVREARGPITTPAPCLDCRRKVLLGEIACGCAMDQECGLQWQSPRHG
jgi:hypothetical protein